MSASPSGASRRHALLLSAAAAGVAVGVAAVLLLTPSASSGRRGAAKKTVVVQGPVLNDPRCSDGSPAVHLRFVLSHPGLAFMCSNRVYQARLFRLARSKEDGPEEEEKVDEQLLYATNWAMREMYIKESAPLRVVEAAAAHDQLEAKARANAPQVNNSPETLRRLQRVSQHLWENPRDIVQDAVSAIRAGDLLTVGELAYLLCSAETPLAVVHPPSVHPGATQFLSVSPMLLHYIQEGVLRSFPPPLIAAATITAAADHPSPRDPSEVSTHLPYIFFIQLLWIHRGLSQVKKEAATAFDDKDKAHVNILQQLWLAGHQALTSNLSASADGLADEPTSADQLPPYFAASASTSANAFAASPSPSGLLASNSGSAPALPADASAASAGAEAAEGAQSGDVRGGGGAGEAAARAPIPPFQPKSSFWVSLGFQSSDPATDLRGAGVLGLSLLVHFAQTYPTAWAEMVKRNRRWATQPVSSGGAVAGKYSPYSVALLCVQLTVLLLSALRGPVSVTPATSKEAGEGGAEGGGDPAGESAAARLLPAATTAVTDPLLPLWGLQHFSLLFDGLVWCASHERLHLDSPLSPLGVGTASEVSVAAGERSPVDLAAPRASLIKWYTSSLSLPHNPLSTEGQGAKSSAAQNALLERYHDWQRAGYEGFHMLHHALLWHFHCCWARDCPPSDQAARFLETVVIPSFFKGG